jgi:hypothetical protein
MTKDDVIRMAHEAGFSGSVARMWPEYFKTFAKLVASAEREACAAMFDDRNVWDEEVGERIRARGNT